MKKSIFGTLLQLESVFLLITGAVSLFHNEKDWWVFMACAALSFVIGGITLSIGKWKARHASSLCLGEGDGTPLQYSCLENPMDGGAW